MSSAPRRVRRRVIRQAPTSPPQAASWSRPGRV
eukprot:CAMPEP_0119368388 /NCGR_PEP_ID=MMETSP1334-20130426/15050_1 /TAXON_ID=127549 /ORGANISM="Calcidiscus leptoporus, Strain RCC1130" /LENGTH=32 /DNA_ID= /DNA_START= /DNA_END= /DNA_ORIENTATION=